MTPYEGLLGFVFGDKVRQKILIIIARCDAFNFGKFSQISNSIAWALKLLLPRFGLVQNKSAVFVKYCDAKADELIVLTIATVSIGFHGPLEKRKLGPNIYVA